MTIYIVIGVIVVSFIIDYKMRWGIFRNRK